MCRKARLVQDSTGMSECRQHPRGYPGRAQSAGRAQRQLPGGVPTAPTHRGACRGHRDQQARPGRIGETGRHRPGQRVPQGAGQAARAVLLVRGEHRAHRLPIGGDRVYRRQPLGRGHRVGRPRRRDEHRPTGGAQLRAGRGAARAAHGQHQVGPCREHPTPFHAPKLARPAPKRTGRTRNHPIRSWRAVADGLRAWAAPGAGATPDRPGTCRCAPWSSCCPGTAGRCSARRSRRAAAGRRRPARRCAACR
ncbi:hypothetical protein EHYA_09800 [Embleya hyalina]|uniref:Uncharacterized protein n=1 Tax=Embleya hyalina TaxID=516124 RepID=A0A401Z5B1_9ACTN|nr:hypothetical protein EHYA_09800 [Embleya hyalina]